MTKINTRSPYFLSFQEPVAQEVPFDCGVAKGSRFQLSITQRGEVVYNDLEQGTVDSISSTDSGFADNKYPDVAIDTSRTVTLKIAIPAGFTNSVDGFFFCDIPAVQPLFNAGTSCTVNTTLNGTIANQTLTTKGGTSSSLNLSTKFTAGSSAITGYRVVNDNPEVLAVSTITESGGASQAIIFTAQENCGVANIQIYALDALTNGCPVFQSTVVTVNGCNVTFDCTHTNGKGGGVASDGIITLVTVNTSIPATGSVSVNSDGSNPIAGSQPFTAPLGANTSGSVRNVSLYFKILIPEGYANTGNGSQYIYCQKTFVQQSQGGGTTTLPAFDCDTANLTGYSITSRGSIVQGKAQTGDIEDFTPKAFKVVQTDTPKTVVFKVRVPNSATVYSNPNALIDCTKTIKMPAYSANCQSYQSAGYLTGPFAGGTDPLIVMDSTQTYAATRSVAMSQSFANLTIGSRVCYRGSSFRGNGFWWGIRSFYAQVGAGKGAGATTMLYIDEYGIIQSIAEWNADAGNGGQGGIK